MKKCRPDKCFKLDSYNPLPLHAQMEKHLRIITKGKKYIDGKNFLPKKEGLVKKLQNIHIQYPTFIQEWVFPISILLLITIPTILLIMLI